MSFQNAIRVLANQQNISETKRARLFEVAEQLKPKIHIAIDKGEFEQARLLMQEAINVGQRIDEHDNKLERFCKSCGGRLIPHSASWFEEFHIDGCE